MHSTDAHCYSCGYDEPLLIGGLMSDIIHSSGPVICDRCHAVTTADYKADDILTCQNCCSTNVLRIDDPQVWLEYHDDDAGLTHRMPKIKIGTFISNEVSLKGHYKCPKCNKFEMKFGTDFGDHGQRSID